MMNLESYLSQLKNNRFLSGVFKLASASIIAQGISFAVLPLLTRLYTTADFGTLSLYLHTLSIYIIISTLNYEVAITSPKSERDSLNIFSLSIICVLGSTSLLALLFIFDFHAPLFTKFNLEALEPYKYFLVFGTLLWGSFNCLNYLSLRDHHYGLLAKTRVLQSSLQAIIQAGAGFLSLGPMGLLSGDLANRSAGISSLSLQVLKKKWQETSFSIQLKEIKKAAIDYKQFPLFGLPSDLLITLGVSLPSIFIAIIWDQAALGLFLLTVKVTGIPSTLLSNSVGRVFYSEASQLGREKAHQLQGLYTKTVGKMISLGGSLTVLISVALYFLSSFLFGESWSQVGLLSLYLIPSMIFRLAVAPVSQISAIIKKQNIEFFLSLTRVIFILATFYYFYVNQMEFQKAILIYSIVDAFLYMLFGAMYFLLVRNFSKTNHTS